MFGGNYLNTDKAEPIPQDFLQRQIQSPITLPIAAESTRYRVRTLSI